MPSTFEIGISVAILCLALLAVWQHIRIKSLEGAFDELENDVRTELAFREKEP
jgi:hypothetical protein